MWNHRIVKRNREGYEVVELCEVYYEHNKPTEPFGYVPLEVFEYLKDFNNEEYAIMALKERMELMMTAFNRDPMKESDFKE